MDSNYQTRRLISYGRNGDKYGRTTLPTASGLMLVALGSGIGQYFGAVAGGAIGLLKDRIAQTYNRIYQSKVRRERERARRAQANNISSNADGQQHLFYVN